MFNSYQAQQEHFTFKQTHRYHGLLRIRKERTTPFVTFLRIIEDYR